MPGSGCACSWVLWSHCILLQRVPEVPRLCPEPVRTAAQRRWGSQLGHRGLAMSLVPTRGFRLSCLLWCILEALAQLALEGPTLFLRGLPNPSPAHQDERVLLQPVCDRI